MSGAIQFSKAELKTLGSKNIIANRPQANDKMGASYYS